MVVSMHFDLVGTIHYSNLAAERARQLTTGKRVERIDRNFQYPICCSAIGQAGFFFGRAVVTVGSITSRSS